jgi:flagellin FlaB
MNNRNTPYKNDDAASIGIGAMIVFIALILVAAVASTIIIKTAEELQQRAEATGDDTRDEISGKVTIVSAHVDGVTTGAVDQILVIAQMSAGSDDVTGGDITYVVVCEDPGTAGDALTDIDLITNGNSAELDGTGIGVGSTIDSGTTFTFEMTLANCNPGAGDAIEVRLIVNGGGETYAQMEVTSLDGGAVLV